MYDDISFYIKAIRNKPKLTQHQETQLFKIIEQSYKTIDKIIHSFKPYKNIKIGLSNRNILSEKIVRCMEKYEKLKRDQNKRNQKKINNILNILGVDEQTFESYIPQFKRAIHNATHAKNMIIEGNLRLAIHVAKKYMGRGIPLSDLIQESNIGLVKAVDKFDYKKGNKFSTVAVWWMRQLLTRAVENKSKTVRIPSHIVEAASKIMKYVAEYKAKTGKEPKIKNVSHKLDIPKSLVKSVKEAAWKAISLQTQLTDDGGTLEDILPGKRCDIPYIVTAGRLINERLNAILNELPEKEKEILTMRYGLFDTKPQTLKEAGEKLGITKERIRQIENQAINRLKHPAYTKKLKEIYEEFQSL